MFSHAGKYEESYNVYRAMLEGGLIGLHLVGDHYDYFVGDAIMLGKERDIESDLLKHLAEADAQSKSAMATFYSGLLIPVSLSAGDYPNAKLHIDRHHARASAKIQANEILFRIFEIAYYYLVGDVLACSQLLEKNFPLFYRTCEREGDARLVYLKLVRARLREREEGVAIPKRLRSQREVFSKVGPYTELSRILFERMGVKFAIPLEK